MNAAIFTFPRAFNEALNAGQSIAVAVNFDSESWFVNDLKAVNQGSNEWGYLKC